MYAVISDSGTQFVVQEGERLLIDLRASAEAGQTIEFDKVLMVGGGDGAPTIGQPFVSGAKVVADVVGNIREKKIHMAKYKRRKNFRVHKAHRRQMTEIVIKQIVA